MTLTEFLLARIAEDERLARSSPDRWGPNHRAAAEAGAKRALVLELERMERDEMGWDGIEAKVMGYLALPYADHPEYREEWRPRP